MITLTEPLSVEGTRKENPDEVIRLIEPGGLTLLFMPGEKPRPLARSAEVVAEFVRLTEKK